VIAPVDLDQFAEAGSAMSGLVDATRPLRARYPDLDFDHPATQRLDRHHDPMHFAELLSGQCRTEIAVARLDKSKRLLTKFVRQLPVVDPSTPLRNQPMRTFDPKLPTQAFNLANPQSELLGGLCLGQSAIDHTAQNL
jgi:hypothetical protein